jgi:glucose-1-phosphate adenylyltransferase
MGRTITVVLGGGRGTRLYPLTSSRAKPAVPLGGKYRLIDIPISNAINSGLREIFVLTQFNSASLNGHLAKTYRFDPFTQGFVEVLAAEQTDASGDWYQGTADAVRQMLHHMDREGVEHMLILSGDHLYRMDYRGLLQRHKEMEADITVSTIPVNREGCEGFGILQCNANGIVTRFKEKPKRDENIDDIVAPPGLRRAWRLDEGRPFLASMGVYIFRMEALREILANPDNLDFGKDILPRVLQTHRVAAYLFDGYWEDIGTIKAFYDANLMLCEQDPPFKFYDEDAPIYTHPRFLPPSLIWGSTLERSIVAEGCVVNGARIAHSIVGLRSWIAAGTTIEDSIIMGADIFQFEAKRKELAAAGKVPVGIGANCRIKRAIIDKNACIGDNCVIQGDPSRPDEDHGSWMIRDGIVCVSKGAVIPPGSVL